MTLSQKTMLVICLRTVVGQNNELVVLIIFNNFRALYQYFTTAANDGLRTSKEKSKYLGLQRHLASIEFVTNLGIMYDALCELADLSTSLRNRSHTFTQANRCIQRRIMVFDSIAENYGPRTKEVIDSCEELSFKSIPLISNKAILKINPLQFFRSLSYNLGSRLFTTQSSNVSMQGNELKNIYTQLLSDLDVLGPKNWSDQFDIQYGDSAIRRLANVFQVDARSAINGFREFKDLGDSSTVLDLRPLVTAIN
ncbi:hypothetical protein AGLY_015548 [Aphis glycines]|uniref:Uncharacterized protein n=1 Tax=Aphis glycines TaxID=307491 RepID=A0A6G0T2D6_APHGL|nr:hypothetical protein AGLY_015548 [Aphis glycines]